MVLMGPVSKPPFARSKASATKSLSWLRPSLNRPPHGSTNGTSNPTSPARSAANNVRPKAGKSGNCSRGWARWLFQKSSFTATLVGVLFFPQREALGLDGRKYDSQLLELIVLSGANSKSFSIATKMLKSFLQLEIPAKQISLLCTTVGSELQQARDDRTEAWQNRRLTDPKVVADPPPALACVQIDGGRIQTRELAAGHGVFNPHWRESKNASFHRMASTSFPDDPHPELPGCFSSRKNMSHLLAGLLEDSPGETVDSAPSDDKPDFSWRPSPLFRSCLASMKSSNEFGPMMAAEANRRGFFTADKRAFLGDGLPYNWAVHRDHFSTFEPILDFIHPIEHLHEVSNAIEPDRDAAWQQTVGWIEDCWQGEVQEVIGILKSKQIAIGLPPKDVESTDVRKILDRTIGYLSNNACRMNYPSYRKQGLPTTSCLIESQIKEMNYRVKGTEKFWNDGPQVEAMLQIVTAILGDEDQLGQHFQGRKGSPYDRTIAKTPCLQKH